jgi:hypothetical protein
MVSVPLVFLRNSGHHRLKSGTRNPNLHLPGNSATLDIAKKNACSNTVDPQKLYFTELLWPSPIGPLQYGDGQSAAGFDLIVGSELMYFQTECKDLGVFTRLPNYCCAVVFYTLFFTLPPSLYTLDFLC